MNTQTKNLSLDTESPAGVPVSKPLTTAEFLVLTLKVLAVMMAVGAALWLLTILSNFISASW